MSKSKLPAMATMKKEDVPTVIEALEKQLQELKGSATEKKDTDGVYQDGTNIFKVDKVSTLLEISASIHAREKAYSEEITRYKVEGKVAPFKVCNFTVEQWEKDIEKAMLSLINRKQIDQVQTAITELKKHLSEQDKFAETMRKIAELAEGKVE